ncbi:MAG TPA: dihydropteroate synthase, partial [Dehalococcoidia bacterium]
MTANSGTPAPIRIGPRTFVWGQRTYVMGILNVSPDSFSGDGVTDVEAALERARRLVAEGADILDVGGESTRPGAAEVPAEEELCRVLPVLRRLRAALDVPISVDTSKAAVAREVLRAGADMINDVWGFRRDPALAAVVAEFGVPAVVMHNQRGRPFHDVIGDITAGLRASFAAARAAGVPEER